jgi:hypothetical protein
MTATQLADVNIQATTLATSHTNGTFSEPDISAPLLTFIVDRLPDSSDSRSSRSALQCSHVQQCVSPSSMCKCTTELARHDAAFAAAKGRTHRRAVLHRRQQSSISKCANQCKAAV